MSNARNRVAAFLVVTAICLPSANAQARTKNSPPKQDGLADYVQRVSAKAPDTCVPTAGKLVERLRTAGQHGGRLQSLARGRSGDDQRGAESVGLEHGQRFDQSQLLGQFRDHRVAGTTQDHRSGESILAEFDAGCCPERLKPLPRLR